MIFDALGELIAKIWETDTSIRTNSALGESEKSRRDRKVIAAICIVLLVGCGALSVIFGL